MSESNKDALTLIVAAPEEGATVHETLVLILRELRDQGCMNRAKDAAAKLDFRIVRSETEKTKPSRAEVNARFRAFLSASRRGEAR